MFFQNLPTAVARGQAGGCQDGLDASGARYRICLPDAPWNGDLVLYAHGYVPAGSPLSLPGEAYSIGGHVRSLGYAFATTSYRTNGLAVQPAIEDLLDLIGHFRQAHGQPRRIFLIGFSEGGLITTLAVERHPEIFAGGLEMCGPAGSFREQVNYFGDFRVVFDALFPGRIPPGVSPVPAQVVNRWERIYREQVLPALYDPANRQKVIQLMEITGAPYDPARPETIEASVRGALGYNIFATNDAIDRLGGNPFDNRDRVYPGGAALNQSVERIAADPAALRGLPAYESTGRLRVPMVAMHTTGDEIVPFAQLQIYQDKVIEAGAGRLLETIPVERFGHCSFAQSEIQQAFARLVQMADDPRLQTQAAPAQAPAPAVLSPVPTTGAPTAGPALQPPQAPENGQPAQPGLVGRLWGWLTRVFRQ